MNTQLNQGAAATSRVAALRSTAAFSSVAVDEAGGVIKNAAVMTIGPASGHGFSIDAVTLQQVHSLISAQPAGVVVRYKHPRQTDEDAPPEDTLGTDVGYLKNVRIEGNAVRGDVHLAEWSSSLPGLGDVRTYLLSKAKNDPAGFGLSAVIGFDVEEVTDGGGNVTALVARVEYVGAVDFVGKPAANPNGLLASRETGPFSIVASIGGRSLTYTAPTIDQVVALHRKACEGQTPTSARETELFAQLVDARKKGDQAAIGRTLASLRNLGVRIQFPKKQK